MNRWIAALALGLAAANDGITQENMINIELTAQKHSYRDAPICVPLSVPMNLAQTRMCVATLPGGSAVDVVFTTPALTTESIPASASRLVRRDAHFILPDLKAGQSVTLKLDLTTTRKGPSYFWKKSDHGKTDLVYKSEGQDKPILRYMHLPFDDSTKTARDKTYKVFHHLFDPDGKRLVTNGGFADENVDPKAKLLYPHHRGIMYGFNKCTYGPDLKKKADIWHCTGDTYLSHEKNLHTEGDTPVLARHRVLLGWHGEKKELFATEERELTAYQLPGGTLIEFASRLKPTSGKVHVDGDPQHAGFQFRAANEVADQGKKQTYYLHPDGKGEMGKERNWPQDKTMVDLPWYSVSFVLDGQRYSLCYLNHPSNPKDSRFSQRYYARIGGYFARDVTEKEPLVVNYRLFLQKGEITPEQAESLRTAFATPPKTVVQGAK